MFSIKIKPSVITLDCFTTRDDVATYSPIKKSSAFIPDWFKDLPTEIFDEESLSVNGTMKSCFGLLSQMSVGFVMPLWSDLIIEVGSENDIYYKWRFSDGKSNIDVHPQYQRGKFLPESLYQHFKIHSPWLFRCDTDIKWQCLAYPWMQEDLQDYWIMNGLLEFKYQNGTNINLIFKKYPTKKIYRLSHGMPLYQFVPLTEKKVIHVVNVLEEKEWFKMKSLNMSTTFLRKYFNNKKLRCPFSQTK